MSEQREFHIAQILSVTTARLLVEIGGVYEILNYLTGDNLYTHQLPRAARECGPYLQRRFPELPHDGENLTSENWREWLAAQVETFGASRMVEPMADGVHEYRDPLAEAVELFGSERVIAITTDEVEIE